MFGYNDMNTNVPNPYATQGTIVLSGAGRKMDPSKFKNIDYKMRTMELKPEEYELMRKRKGNGKEPEFELYGSGMDDMDGAGWMDDIKKGYSKAKSAVKSETGQKIKKALVEDKGVMKEFNKAKKQLDDYTSGARKSPPGKAAMAILEQAGVISKIENEFKGAENKSGKISRIKKAKKWRDFAVDSGYDGVDLARYGYENFKEATNPIQAEAKKAAKGISKMFGGAKRGPSPWISFVKDFSLKNGIPYKQALKEASPIYKKMKKKM